MPRWLLPENISDILPLEARRVEELRRALLDLYRSYGYELVIPPLIEYLDSLLTGTGSDLDLRMFKLTDQASGRLLGLRADATPQVARIDAHILNRQGVARLCYAGSVLHARPLHPLASREPLQVGAELYGASGPQADAEVIELAVASLRLAGLSAVHLDLGHTAVVRALLDLAPPAPAVVDDLLAALSSKDEPWLRGLVSGMPPSAAAPLLELLRLNGGLEVIGRARSRLPALPPISAALDELETIAANSGAEVSFDLADLHGYRYHNGVTFAVHVEGLPAAVLRGGRYDGIIPHCAHWCGNCARRARSWCRRCPARTNRRAISCSIARSHKRTATGAWWRARRPPRNRDYRWHRTWSSSARSGVTKARARSSTG
jgi:ATP phosphoribosyltransferase regulatory subunit